MEEMTAMFTDGMVMGVLSDKTGTSAKTDPPAESCPASKGRLPEDMPIGMAYVPMQYWEKTYEEKTALARGTIFPALDKPFIGEEAVKNGR